MAALRDNKDQNNPPRDVRCVIDPIDHLTPQKFVNPSIMIDVCKSPHDFHSPDLTAFSPGCSQGPSSALHPRSLLANLQYQRIKNSAKVRSLPPGPRSCYRMGYLGQAASH
ncbi:hypothetical protein ABVK25_000487 [Lepraria finkii]|uniref:Uncharacterized protein n=1 Tax=Lepraria finkii TaxID=1340010 RepID=A0ABR4BN39_9LECA